MLIDGLWEHTNETFPSEGDVDLLLSSVAKLPGVDPAYEEALRRGGMHAFSRGLRVFGLTEHPRAKNVVWWNDPAIWKSEFAEFFTNVWAFAEDVFGNQFMFDEGGVVWLQVETGELKFLCRSFTQWMDIVREEPDFYSAASIVRAWEAAHPDEGLTGMYHLSPVTLFVCGGGYELENLFRCEAREHMAVKANIARQIRDLPDGAKIELSFDD